VANVASFQNKNFSIYFHLKNWIKNSKIAKFQTLQPRFQRHQQQQLHILNRRPQLP